MVPCLSPSGVDLCMNGIKCNTTTLTCDCSASAFEHDFQLFHNENCGLARDFYDILLIYLVVIEGLVIIFVAYETSKARSEAKSIGISVVVMLIFSVACVISVCVQHGTFEAGSIFLGAFISMVLVVIYRFAMVFIGPIYAVRSWNINELRAKIKPLVIFGCFTLMTNAILLSVYSRQIEMFNIAMVVFVLQIVTFGILAGCSLASFAVQLLREVQQINKFNESSPLNVPAIRGRIFHAFWGGIVVVVVCAGILAPVVGVFLGLGMLPYSWITAVLAYHAIIGLAISVGLFLHQRVRKSSSNSTENRLSKLISGGGGVAASGRIQSKLSKTSDI